ncbi:hypothetical protein [Nocardiopsis baichengensis]|uniref:hypothetical protein n=1 Tax=Nocardiopsis baichengensis TaxID=280240 RepID=UPI001EF9E759|nr:hypothetical protein [Nocardiopsis baichengensis]
MRPKGMRTRTPRCGGAAFAALLSAILLMMLALAAHHGTVPRVELQESAPASATTAVSEAAQHRTGPFGVGPAGSEQAASGLAAASPSGHEYGGHDHGGHDHGGHEGSDDQRDCGPASGTCQSAKVTVDVALPPRARLVLPNARPLPPVVAHPASAALPTPPDLAELSILRI